MVDEDVRDFTVNRKPIAFKLGGATYRMNPRMSPTKIKSFLALQGELTKLGGLTSSGVGGLTDGQLDDLVDTLARMFEAMVGGADGKALAEEIRTSEDIDLMAEAMPAFYYLLESVGLRPTRQSSDSSSEPATGDSTDGAPAMASTGEESPGSINS